MSEQPYTVEQALSALEGTPKRIAAVTTDPSPEQLSVRPQPEEWSVNEILAHLRACADVWGGYMLRIITEDSPAFRAVSPRSYSRKTDYAELDFRTSFHAFAEQRAELLAKLQRQPRESWSRSAIVTKDGKVNERTVLYYADMMARHEGVHITQIEQTVEALRL